MLLIRALLLWSILSLHVVGGAMLFRRLFPRESPWFGFLVPGLALVLVMNFIEHLVALPSLLWLLPYTTLGFIWVLAQSRGQWKGLRLPTGIFLASFAFTFALRCLRPDIQDVRDGVVDLSLLASFCMGEKLPPSLIWYPPVHLSQYYVFGHYAMSVVTRLLGLDVGTGFNLSSALLGAFDCFLAAAAAWRIGRQKIWLAILAPILLEGAATGASAFLWFIAKGDFDPNQAANILFAMDDPAIHQIFGRVMHQGEWYNRSELMPPGAWSWLGSFHSTCGGQFLTLFLVWSLAEVLRRRPANWPWICAGSIPFLTLITSSYGVPLDLLLILGTLFWVWHYRLSPRNLAFVLMGIGGVVALLMPFLMQFLTTSAAPAQGWTDADNRTQLVEFLVLWWPVFLPWLILLPTWPRLSPLLKTIIVVLPIVLIGMEFYIMGGRPDWTSKLWGYVFGAGWITLIPALLRRRGILFRAVGLVLICSSLISFFAWAESVQRGVRDQPEAVLHLEGTGQFRENPLFGNILQILSSLKGQTIIPGKSGFMYCTAPFLADFAGNRIYVTWDYFCDVNAGGETYGQAARRTEEVNNLLDGHCDNPLLFLRTRDIAALVIYPDDDISDRVVAQLKAQLSPYYAYSDFRSFDPDHKTNSGVFVFQPQLAVWPASAFSAPPAPVAAAKPAAPVVSPAAVKKSHSSKHRSRE